MLGTRTEKGSNRIEQQEGKIGDGKCKTANQIHITSIQFILYGIFMEIPLQQNMTNWLKQ